MLCINCDRAATWLFSPGGIRPRSYCDLCLPNAYRGTAAVSPAPVERPKVPRARKTPQAVPEVVPEP